MDAAWRHTRLARVLHWAFVLALPLQAWLGWTGERTADRSRGMELMNAHFGLGMLLLALIAVRTVRRLIGTQPVPAADLRAWQRHAATSVHAALYVLLWLLPLSGYVIWVWMGAPRSVFGLFEIPRLFVPPHDDETGRAIAWYLHVYGAWLLGALIALHLAAVAWHQWVRRDGLLSRML